jgi:hypothetical protein
MCKSDEEHQQAGNRKAGHKRITTAGAVAEGAGPTYAGPDPANALFTTPTGLADGLGLKSCPTLARYAPEHKDGSPVPGLPGFGDHIPFSTGPPPAYLPATAPSVIIPYCSGDVNSFGKWANTGI